MGDWGLGIGDWGLGPIPNPQSPIPNPHNRALKKSYHFYNIKKKFCLNSKRKIFIYYYD